MPQAKQRNVILVDAQNQPSGECSLAEAHRSPGLLHRAFSVYVFSQDARRLLLQRRHEGKLFGGAWANTCCSHPLPGEEVVAAGRRRLREELGIDCELRQMGGFVYQAEDPNGRGAEHEYDVLLAGLVDPAIPIQADPTEVAAWKWAAVDALLEDLRNAPKTYAPWLRLGLPLVLGGTGHEAGPTLPPDRSTPA